jgi:hypothetical protein
MEPTTTKKIQAFLEYAGERALKTVAQTALASIAASQVIGILDVDWLQIVSVAALAGILSLLTSVAFPTKSPDGE